MAKQTLRIDSELESFLHSVFRTVVPLYPAKAPARKRSETAAPMGMFAGQTEEKGWVMIRPFQYELGTCQTVRPCLLVISAAENVQCLPGRTCDLRQGLPGGVVYQISIEGDFLAPAFKRSMQQMLTAGTTEVNLEPDYSFLPRLVNTFPALGKEVNKLEEERRVWKIEQLDDPAYLKTVDRALKRVLDKLFVVGKDATDKKGVYQAGINALIGLQKQFKSRAELIGTADWSAGREWLVLAAVVRAIAQKSYSLATVKVQAEMNEELGKRFQNLLAEYFQTLTKKEKSRHPDIRENIEQDIDIQLIIEKWNQFLQ